MRPGWFTAWSKAFETRIELAAVQNGVLRALAPLVPTRRGLTSPVNQESPGFALLASDPESRMHLAHDILSQRCSEVALMRVTLEDVEVLDEAARRSRLRVVRERMERSPFIPVKEPWETYESTLDKRFRQNLRRRTRRLGEEGEMAFDINDGSENLAPLLDEGFALESLGWKGRGGTAIDSGRRTSTFYSEIARWAAERGWLRLWFLRLEGKAIAFRLDVNDGIAYYGLKVAHDPAHARFSPGIILQHETVRYAFEKGLERFEFLGADEPYKLRWTETTRDLVAWRAFSRGPRGSAAWFGRAVARPLARKIRGSRPA
jgi:CelD/BcsL family acetyltransferase involved in cellulose biosynthesis